MRNRVKYIVKHRTTIFPVLWRHTYRKVEYFLFYTIAEIIRNWGKYIVLHLNTIFPVLWRLKLKFFNGGSKVARRSKRILKVSMEYNYDDISKYQEPPFIYFI